MKKNVLIVILIFKLSANLYGQNGALFCKGKGYQGYVFDTSYFVLKSVKQQQGKINLSCDEVKIAEEVLNKELLNFNKDKINQSQRCPDINKNLHKYCRQYFGFINTNGEKIVWINLFWNRAFKKMAKYELVNVNDGCSYYWNIEVNISAKTISNLQINGKG